MVKRIKSLEKKLKHNCTHCLSTYTLLETHLSKKDLSKCPTNCLKAWETTLHKYCQEKVLGQELTEQENINDYGSN